MLTREHAIVVYEQGEAFADRLTRLKHAHYVRLAERMLEIYRQGIGYTRQQLHLAVQNLFSQEDHCPARRIHAFCKLLDEVATYDRDRRGRAAKLRQHVFQRAANHHPLVERPDSLFESNEAEIKQQIAAELNRDWKDIENSLFADVISHQRLLQFAGYSDALALLSRYNVAQAQATLYNAESMTIRASQDLKTILRYAKLARLLHTLTRDETDDWRIELSGPASSLRSTRRYGVQFAKFLPALLACRGWRMSATLVARGGKWRSRFRLTSESGLQSVLPAPEDFDSSFESQFAGAWGEDPREGWSLHREAEVLHEGQRTFVPDFALRHESGVHYLLEIAGFWTPEYLAAKRETLNQFGRNDLILAVPESIAGALGSEWVRDYPQLIVFKNRLKPTAVLDWLGRATDRT